MRVSMVQPKIMPAGGALYVFFNRGSAERQVRSVTNVFGDPSCDLGCKCALVYWRRPTPQRRAGAPLPDYSSRHSTYSGLGQHFATNLANLLLRSLTASSSQCSSFIN